MAPWLLLLGLVVAAAASVVAIRCLRQLGHERREHQRTRLEADRLVAVLEEGRRAAFWCDGDFVLQWTNSAFDRFAAASLGEGARPRSLRQIFGDGARDRIDDEILVVAGRGRTWRGELEIVGDGGETRVVSCYFVPQLDDRGQLGSLAGTLEDVTEALRVRRDRQRRFAWQHLTATISRSFLTETPEPIDVTLGRALERLGWFVDADCCRLDLGADATHRVIRWLRPGREHHDDHGRTSTSRVRGRLARGQIVRHRLPGRGSSGSTENAPLPADSSSVTVPLRLGREILGLLEVVRHGRELELSERDLVDLEVLAHLLSDAIARHRTLDRLAEREAQLRQAQKMESVGQLAGGIAHDFNNLLTVIKGFSADVLSRADLDPETRSDLRDIETAADRGAELVQQLLAFSRGQQTAPTACDLNQVVLRIAAILRRSLGRSIEVATECASPLGAVHADPHQLEQVLVNLVLNARDAMPEGRGTIVIRTVRGERDDRVGLQVEDDGSGMPPEILARVFDPFFTTKEPGSGTGLGLSTVHGIVAQAGGTIDVSSEVGSGTTFTVWLPAMDVAAVGT